MPNYLIIANGRGALYAGLANHDDVHVLADKLQTTVDQGFEVYIYSLTPSPTGNLTFFPQIVLPVKREYHLYDQSDVYHAVAHDIVDGLDRHSREASKAYLQLVIEDLNTALSALKEVAKDNITTGS